jgi:hypothetical protein
MVDPPVALSRENKMATAHVEGRLNILTGKTTLILYCFAIIQIDQIYLTILVILWIGEFKSVKHFWVCKLKKKKM